MGCPSPKFLLATMLTAFCSFFQWGYHGCVINVPESLFKRFINESIKHQYGVQLDDNTLILLYSWTVSIFSIGALIGSLITPILAEKLGRKPTLLVWANVASIIASLMMTFCQAAQSLELLMVGRLIIGAVTGLQVCLSPVYLYECSPPDYRDLMGTFQNFFVNLCTMLSFGIAVPEALGNATFLPALLGLGAVPAAIQLISSFFLHESPRYLYIKRKDKIAAEKSIKFWSASSNPDSVDAKERFKEYEEESQALSQEVGLTGAMKVPYFRRIMFVTIVLMVCQAGTGAPAVYNYSTQLFTESGLSHSAADLCSEMLAISSTVSAVVIAPVIIAKFTRRTVFFSTFTLSMVCLLAYAVPAFLYARLHLSWMGYVAAGSLFAYGMVFNCGIAPLAYIIPPEMAPQAIRSTVNATGWTISWLLVMISTFVYPPLDQMLGTGAFFIFIPPSVAAMIYLYKAMPETAKQTVAEIVRKNSSPQRQTVQVQFVENKEASKA